MTKLSDKQYIELLLNNTFGREVWNRAIEKAAAEAKDYLNSVGYQGTHTREAILKLKV